MPFDVSARGESGNAAPRRGMGANRWPTPRTRGRMRWERRLYGMKQQAGASCLSRTPSISLAPPRLLWSTFLALLSSFSPAPFPPLPRPTLQTTQTRRSSQLPRVTQRLFLPTAAPLPSFPSIYQGSKELGSELGRMSRDHEPFSPFLFSLLFGAREEDWFRYCRWL